jgi:hypothetical protein
VAPLVSIGLPTHERAATLERAIASALGQTHTDLELVISDNASGDDTPALCRAAAERDPRVRVVRHPENLGPTANFNSLFAALQGTYAMVLADDDHLDPDYVERCLAALQADPSLAVVCGLARYERDGAFSHDGHAVDLLDADPAARVRSYFSAPGDGPFYGLCRADALRAAAPMPNVLANDWLMVARMAMAGKVRTLTTTRIHRALGGTSADIAGILHAFDAPSFQARVPHLVMAGHAFADIGWRASAYSGLAPRARWALAVRSAPGVIDWPSFAWHLTAPTAARLGRRPRSRWIWRAYDRITRALGAGQQP